MLHFNNIGALVAQQRADALHRAASYRLGQDARRARQTASAGRRATRSPAAVIWVRRAAGQRGTRSPAAATQVWRAAGRQGIVRWWARAIHRDRFLADLPTGPVGKEA